MTMNSFLRFLLVGAFNTCFGYGLIFGFMYLAMLSPELSNFLAYVIAVLVSFLLNKYYTFADGKRHGRGRGKGSDELLRFLIVFALAYGANYLVLLLLLYQFGAHPALSQVLAGVVYVLISYALNARFVFRYR